MKPVRALRVLFAVIVAAACVPEPLAAGPEPPARRVLLVAPQADLPGATLFGAALTEASNQDVTVIAMADYAPLVDAEAYDGFVVLGTIASDVPKPGLLEDLRGVDKPVLWVGHHAELLGSGFLEPRGLVLEAPVAEEQRLLWGMQRPLVRVAHSIRIGDRSLGVLSMAGADDTESVAAVRIGRFGYAAAIPSFDPASADMAALQWLAQGVLGVAEGPAPPAPDLAARLTQARADPFAAAVHLPVYISETRGDLIGYDGDALHRSLVRIRDAGAEWVVIQRIHYQHGVGANTIFVDPVRTATDASLANIVADAHKLGLKVRLVPVVNLTEESRRPGDWRGFIQPESPDLWWARYREIILHDAALARDHGIEALDIGAELNALEPEIDRWRSLAAAVRGEAGYPGLIGYQVNFDVVTRLTWTDILDYLAIAAYWPLSETADPAVDDLVDAWERIWADVGPWVRDRPDLRVEFGEIGYAAQPFASVFPFSWMPDRQRRLDVREQLSCYLALERFLAAHPEIRGVSIFASTNEDTLPEGIGYSPFAKPAAEVVRRILDR